MSERLYTLKEMEMSFKEGIQWARNDIKRPLGWNIKEAFNHLIKALK